MGYVREDVIQRKVFFWHVDSTSENLLYNFGMEPGDTINLTFPIINSYYKSGTYRLNAINSFTAQQTSTPRKEFRLTPIDGSSTYPLRWVEGIGNMAELVYPYIEFVLFGGLFGCDEYNNPSSYQILTCFEHDYLSFHGQCAWQQASYQSPCINVLDTCTYVQICSGINSESFVSSFEVYPNPTIKDVVIKLDITQEERVNFCLLDMHGRAVTINYEMGSLAEGIHHIPLTLNHIPSGLYFIACSTQNARLYKKLIVE